MCGFESYAEFFCLCANAVTSHLSLQCQSQIWTAFTSKAKVPPALALVLDMVASLRICQAAVKNPCVQGSLCSLSSSEHGSHPPGLPYMHPFPCGWGPGTMIHFREDGLRAVPDSSLGFSPSPEKIKCFSFSGRIIVTL